MSLHWPFAGLRMRHGVLYGTGLLRRRIELAPSDIEDVRVHRSLGRSIRVVTTQGDFFIEPHDLDAVSVLLYLEKNTPFHPTEFPVFDTDSWNHFFARGTVLFSMLLHSLLSWLAVVACTLVVVQQMVWEEPVRMAARQSGMMSGRNDYRNGVRKLHRPVHDGSQRPLFLGMDGPFEIWTDPQPEESWWFRVIATPLNVQKSEYTAAYEQGMRDAFRKEQEKTQTPTGSSP